MTLWIEKLRMVRCSIVTQGNLDPFDGLVTYRLVQEAGEAAAAAALSLLCKAHLSLLQLPMPAQAAIQPALARHPCPAAEQPGVLRREIADMERMVENKYRRWGYIWGGSRNVLDCHQLIVCS